MASNDSTQDNKTPEEEDTGSNQITIHVKNPKETKSFKVAEGSSVKDFKLKIAPEFGNPPLEQLCLIFAGKIMKDHENLNNHKIKDGMTVHLVVKTGSSGQNNNQATSEQRPAAPRPDPSQTPFGLGGLGGISGLSNLGMGSANFMEMQQQIQSGMMSNPDFMRQVMDSPLTQSLMSNPEIMRGLIQSNPQMRQLMERNPELNHMLNNPEILRQTMEIARNPAMMQELMRNQDRAMSNLESIPGGQSALQRMYRDIQEPMLNAAQEQFGSNPFQALAGSRPAAQAPAGGPLPNPWAQPAPQPAGNNESQDSSNLTGGALFASPGMQSLLQQMTESPQLMQNMLSAPYTQAVMRELASNPDMASSIFSSNPLFAGNPALQEQMRAAMPAMMQQMQNPAVQNLLTNPDALQAISQIQEGLQRLQRAAPDLYNTMGMPNLSMGMNLFAGGAGSTTAGSTNSTPSTTTTTAGGTPAGGMSADGMNAFQQMMSTMVNQMSQQGLNTPPEERFRIQLETLANMGFIDRQANIQALIATAGDVNAAIDRLLQQTSSNQQS